MKLVEKILIGLVIGFLCLYLLTGISIRWFTVATWLLAISYLFGGFWILNFKGNKQYLIPIFSGIAFAASLLMLPHIIAVRRGLMFDLLPLLNAALFLGLCIWLFIKRFTAYHFQNIKPVFIRSAIILAVVGFFSFIPVTFKPYRDMIITLNAADKSIVGNMQMFNYTYAYEKAIKKGDCEQAIMNAEKSNQAGLAWLGISKAEVERSVSSDTTPVPGENTTHFVKEQLKRISATFTNLYTAYTCQADIFFKNGEYQKALDFYLKGYNTLTSCDHHSPTWKTEESFSLNSMALCYRELQNYVFADSLFFEAIEKYEEVKDTLDRNVSIFYSNWAESFSHQKIFGYSNQLYKASIRILQTDSSNEENRKDIFTRHTKLIENHFKTDSLREAAFHIQESYRLVDTNSVNFCKVKLYDGVYYYKISKYHQSNTILAECLTCYKNFLGPSNQNFAEIHLLLAQVNLALAKYEFARDNLDKGSKIAVENFGHKSIRYTNFLIWYAHLDKEEGNYEDSEKKYNQVLEIYKASKGERNDKFPEVLASLADLQIILGNIDLARKYSDSSMTIATQSSILNIPGSTWLLNKAAYVNYWNRLYNKADSLYRETIKINENYGLTSSVSTAVALNGQALIMVSRQKYKYADSAFTRSLELHKNTFSENHPMTATVILNMAILKIKENKLKEAEELLARAMKINRIFFKEDHDIFANIYVAYGDLSQKQRQSKLAMGYYQKALDIYLTKFDQIHPRISQVRNEIKTLLKFK